MSDPADVLSLPFDQYQRYRLVSDLLDQLREGDKPLKVLDVGGRTALLRDFLPKDQITLVDMEPSEQNGLVLGNGCELPFKDESFDVVAGFDTLEHIPPDRREDFIGEFYRVARRYAVLAGPYRASRVQGAEKLLRSFLEKKLKIQHRYLKEHHTFGLPSRRTVEAQLRAMGAEILSVGHGNLDRWLALMCVSMYMDHHPVLREIAAQFHRFYNDSLYASDHQKPVYRHVVIAAFNGAPLPDAESVLDPPVAPAGALGSFHDLAMELMTFDHEVDVWDKEWKRLLTVNEGLRLDLEGHKETLDEITALNLEQEEVIERQSVDLAGHTKSLKASKKELEEVKRAAKRSAGDSAKVREELEQTIEQQEAITATQLLDLAGHEQSIADLKAELETAREVHESSEAAHAEVRETLESDLAGHEQVIQNLETDLEGHRGLVSDVRSELEESEREREAQRAGYRADLEGHQEVIGTLEADLAEHKATIESQRQEQEQATSEHAAERESLEADLAGHRASLDELRGDFEGIVAEREKELAVFELEREEYAAQREVLETDLAGHREVITNVSSDLEGHRGLVSDLRKQLERLERARLDERGAYEEVGADLRNQIEELRAGLNAADERYASFQAEHEKVRADLESDLEQHRLVQAEHERLLAERMAVIEQLREELRNRWHNLKRGLRWKIPG